MKKAPLTLLLFFFFIFKTFAQQYPLTVVNGYGSGNYAAGDTVHIWSEEWTPNQIFKNWTGQTAFLEASGEWHTRLVMPAQAVTVTANIRTLPAGADYSFEEIRGRDTLKRVYYYFPQGAAPKGVVWLSHGTNGSANAWVNVEYEQRQFANYLMADTIAVVVTEAEEVTYNTDFSGDGNLRWAFTSDSVGNVDIANYRAIRDTFINRGWISPNTPHAAVGFSAGGTFAVLVSAVLDWRAGISHCANGPAFVIQNTQTPTLLSMNQHDVGGDDGPLALMIAYDNVQLLKSKGVCSEFNLLRPSPVYPERFKRLANINGAVSQNIYNELKNNGCLNADNFLTKPSWDILSLITANPAAWPVSVSLNTQQRNFVVDQIDVMWTAHHFHSDYMAADLTFIKSVCGMPVSTNAPQQPVAPALFPNPARDVVNFSENVESVQVFDVRGRLVLSAGFVSDRQLDISALESGLFFIHLRNGDEFTVFKLVKI